MYEVRFSRAFQKSLKKIPKQYHKGITKLIDRLEQDPFTVDIKKLQSNSEASHRVRIGSYRIFITIDTEVKIIIIVDIRRRTTQTYS